VPSRTKLREARDDRLVAAIDVGVQPWGAEDEDEGENEGETDQEKEKAKLRHEAREEASHGIFAVAYVVRAVTQGSFALPEAVVEDMYRPGTMARTEARTTTVAAKP
jgi:uncharacterized protein YfaS (alpha-2-macroglobulin family)